MDNVTREEFEQLRQFVLAMDSRFNREKGYDSADKAGIRQTEGMHGEAIEQNTSDITDTMEGLTDTYEDVQTNTSDIDTCMNAITELYEMIGGNE